jgi:DNA-binding FrmR family transcriptional regulator
VYAVIVASSSTAWIAPTAGVGGAFAAAAAVLYQLRKDRRQLTDAEDARRERQDNVADVVLGASYDPRRGRPKVVGLVDQMADVKHDVADVKQQVASVDRKVDRALRLLEQSSRRDERNDARDNRRGDSSRGDEHGGSL